MEFRMTCQNGKNSTKLRLFGQANEKGAIGFHGCSMLKLGVVSRLKENILYTRFFPAASVLAMTLLASGLTHSQDYPSKPIRIITTAAGGGGDFTTRQVAQG